MKMQVVRVVIVLSALVAGTAQAEVYIGAGVSSNSYDYSDLDNSSGSKLYVGYYMSNGAFVEAASIKLGDTESDLAPLGLDIKGTALYVGYRSQAATGFGGFGKIGMYSFTSDLTVSGSTVDDVKSSGLAWSIGFTYAFNKNVALRGELEQFVGVDDFADDKSITGPSLSLEFRF